jgi:hypothetical protein
MQLNNIPFPLKQLPKVLRRGPFFAPDMCVVILESESQVGMRPELWEHGTHQWLY